MPLVVSLSQGVLQNLIALQNTTNLINTVQNQLATGKKVNSALDNPANFFLSNTFQTSINTLNTLLDGINLGQRTLDAANTGITDLTNLLSAASGTLQQALSSTQTTAKYTGTVANLTTASSFSVASGHTITVSDGTTTASFTSTGNTTVANIVNQVNNTAGLQVKAELSGDGRILFEATGATAITIGGTATAGEQAQFGLVAGATAAGVVSSSRSNFAAQYDALRTQIDQMAIDSGFNGTSLLNGQSLTVTMNQSATAKLVLSGNIDTSAGLGVVASTNTFQTDFDIHNAQTLVAAALVSLQNQSSTYASQVSVIQARSDFTNQQIATLQTGINNLVLADANQAGAQLLALQTRQTLSSTALSLATQSDQNVLRLFR